MDWVGYEWARSAARHRIARSRTIYVMERCGKFYALPPEPGRRDERLLFLGDDPSGNRLEVMAVELAKRKLLVIHSMKMRPRYLSQYLEARLWQM
jgi:hypothetical protein